MNEEKQNQTYYQETFREVHAPQNLAERLRNMEAVKNKKKTNSVAKGFAVAAIAAVVLFAGSNVVAYATTGSTWVETVMEEFMRPGVDLIVEEDRVCIVDGDKVIDVTEELKNTGSVQGTYETEDCIKEYKVYIKGGQHHLDVKYHYKEKAKENEFRPVQSGMVVAGTPTPTPEP